ncbi:MAG: DUF1549 and DUF1553 domain-containing protein [Acidobacteriota bacterium]|nr:DUF1549 and DUF1553 domain-containing protein [Acidobacteriota bacterium]
MKVAAVFATTSVLTTCLLAGDAVKPKEESMSSDRFSEAHAPLFQPPKSQNSGALTVQVAPSLPAARNSAPVALHNYIDREIFGKMAKEGIPHAGLASDYEFLRRVTLDLTGQIPSAADIRSFVQDKDAAKRDKAIDKLLASEAFVDKWAYFFMDVFRANGKMGRGQNLFHYWMKENLRVDRPYDDVARSIMAAAAKSNHVVAAANVIAREHVQAKGQPDDGDDLGMIQQLDTDDELAILYGKTFLGLNLSCISCHDGKSHLEKVNVWLSQRKRSEFFQNAAFLGRSRYLMYWEDGKPQSGEFLIDDRNPGYVTKSASQIRVPRFGGPGDPAFILTGETPRPGAEQREEFGRMLTAHPQFARATVNQFWAKFMSFGIVEPFDEFDLARQDPKTLPAGWDLQPSHPELLNALAKDFSSHQYSVKHLFRTICQSSAYQLSAQFDGEWKDSYTKYYARKFVRMLSAEELHDSIAVATSRPGSFKGADSGMAMHQSGPAGSGDVRYFMQTFGEANRNNPPRPLTGSPLQPLLLMQSPVVTDRVKAAKDSRVQRLLDTYKEDNNRVVDELFIATLSRPATAAEKQVALAAMQKNRVDGAQDLQWALINQVEFFFNY